MHTPEDPKANSLEWLEPEASYHIPYARKLIVVVVCSDAITLSDVSVSVDGISLGKPLFSLRRPARAKPGSSANRFGSNRCLLVYDCALRPSNHHRPKLGLRGEIEFEEGVPVRPATPFQLRRLVESFSFHPDLESFIARIASFGSGAVHREGHEGPSGDGSEIALDSLEGSLLRGHALDPSTWTPLGIEIWLGDHRVGETAPTKRRDDVARQSERVAGIGFEFDFVEAELPPELSSTGQFPLVVRARIRGADAETRAEFTVSRETYRGWIAVREAAVAARVDVRRKAVAELGASHPTPDAVSDVGVIAFYLPQFHPIAENDAWWGDGFTEWSNVVRARPAFEGHAQPHLPADLGFYDLRVPDVRHKQIGLAKEHGISGFCFYYYWFGGRRLLERPLDEYVADSTVDFPFCICWANENWSRRWDGSESELLIGQPHNVVGDQRFIRDVIPLLKDPRYIRVGGAPLVLVYRVPLLEDPRVTAERWRTICREEGVGEIHLAMAETFGSKDPTEFGFDSSVQFPPHSVPARELRPEGLDPAFQGKVYDYRDIVAHEINEAPTSHTRFRGVMLGWDNSARRGLKAHIYHHASPELYETWLRAAIHAVRRDNDEGERLVFVNAWNEWAEGTHLEPDMKFGRAYLHATRRAVSGMSEWPVLLAHARHLAADRPELQSILGDLERVLVGQDRSLELLRHPNLVLSAPAIRQSFSPHLPETLDVPRSIRRGRGDVDEVNGRASLDGLAIGQEDVLSISGSWTLPDRQVDESKPAFFALRSVDGAETYYVPIADRSFDAEADVEGGAMSGGRCSFSLVASLDRLRIGRYKAFGVLRADRDNLACWSPFHGIIEVVAR